MIPAWRPAQSRLAQVPIEFARRPQRACATSAKNRAADQLSYLTKISLDFQSTMGNI
jgi:hypothetical protein